MTRKRRIGEGQWVEISLDGGFAYGCVARTGSSGVLLGYFYVFRESLALNAICALHSSEADAIARFGDLAIRRGTWRVLDRCDTWDRERWPVPTFLKRDPLRSDVWWHVQYSEEDISQAVARQPSTGPPNAELPHDGTYGYQALEIMLARILIGRHGGSPGNG